MSEPKTAACKFISSRTIVVPKPGKFPDVNNASIKGDTSGTDNIEDQKYQEEEKDAAALMHKAAELLEKGAQLDKQATVVVPAGIGALIGALKARKGERARGAGYGAGIGAGTGLGASIGGLAGAGLGAGLGVGLGAGAFSPFAGALLGTGAGGYGGYLASKGIAEDMAVEDKRGVLPWVEDREKKRDGDGDGKINDGTPEEKDAAVNFGRKIATLVVSR